jgi:hypothetical protein
LPNLFHASIPKVAIILGILIATARVAPAQALETADRGSEITPFAQYTVLSPDWGGTKNIGYTVGLDYTRFIRSIVQPSLELRASDAGGSTVGEHSFIGGLKLQTTIHRIRPYATFLAGKGFITFDQPINGYISDNSFIVSLGAGAIFTIHSQLDLRLDFTHQQWNIDPQTLTPATLGIGIAYRIPFHNGRVE